MATMNTRRHPTLCLGLLCLALACQIGASSVFGKDIYVFVALCDNDSQGIIKVGERIGNGDDPQSNLYWGCSDGLKLYFKNSSNWTLTESKKDPAEGILEELTLAHKTFEGTRLIAHAYRGTEMRRCMEDYLRALTSRDHPADLVAYIGHNALMDARIPIPELEPSAPQRDTAILCCLSRQYFWARFDSVGIRPILLTEQLMYPGAFILHDVIEGWLRGESKDEMRLRAARAYARNQSISVGAAKGIFTDLE